MKKVGILFHPKIEAAQEFARELKENICNTGVEVWVCSSWDEEGAKEHTAGTEMLVSLGGDGTVLRAARIADADSVPLIGINLGRLGFLTEVSTGEALGVLRELIDGKGLIEERAMLEASVISRESPQFRALNDVVVARGERCRLIRVKATIDGQLLATYKCDGIIAATATGSTGYSMAAGGPLLHPLAKDIVLQPVAVHLGLNSAFILQPDSIVEFEVNTKHQATMSIDGQLEVPLVDGDIIRVRRSTHTTRLLRISKTDCFYSSLIQKLAKDDGRDRS